MLGLAWQHRVGSKGEKIVDTELKKWAHIERQFLKDDLAWLKAGAKLVSPSGHDITKEQIERLEARLEHVDIALGEGKH